MKENRMDRITDKIKERVGRIVGEAHNQFKGANPYRQEAKSNRERLLEYSQMTPETEMFLRQGFGDMIVDNYKTKMETLLQRYVK